MITSKRRSPSGLPTYAQIKERGFSDQEARNILSMEGDPQYIWDSFLSAKPAAEGELEKLNVDIFGRDLTPPASAWFSQ